MTEQEESVDNVQTLVGNEAQEWAADKLKYSNNVYADMVTGVTIATVAVTSEEQLKDL